MTLFGLPLRRPSFAQFTSSVILGVGLWAFIVGAMQRGGAELTGIDAASALVVVLWGCVAVALGIPIARGLRHLAVNLGVSALLLGALQVGAQAFGG